MTIKYLSISAILPLALLVGSARVHHDSTHKKAVTETVFLRADGKPLRVADISAPRNRRLADESAKNAILAYLKKLDNGKVAK